MHPLCSIELHRMMDVTGNVITLYCTYVHYSRKNRRGQSTPSRCTTGWRFRRRGRRVWPPVAAAPALQRRGALLAARPGPRRSGWPWSRSLRGRRVARWRAGAGQWQALRRQGQRACSCLARVRGWRVVYTVGMRYAPFGPLWRLRSVPLEDSLRSASPPSPPREAKVCPRLRPGHAAGSAAIACVSARPAARPRQLAALPAPALPGCQALCGESGAEPPTPPGRHAGPAVGGRRSAAIRSATAGAPGVR